MHDPSSKDEARRTVVHAVADAVAREGCVVLFCLVGGGNQDLLVDLAERHGVRLVHARHEQNAVAMADGYARFGGRIGFCSVTQGPGLTNAATSLIFARAHKSPVLLVAGDTPIGDPFNPQEMDQLAFSQLTAGAGAVIEVARMVDYCLDSAFKHLRGGHGPFVLNAPVNVQNSPLPDPSWSYRPKYRPSDATQPDPVVLSEAAAIIGAALRPAIIAGLGAERSGAQEAIESLAELLGAPLATSLMAKGMCAAYPLSLGVAGGLGSGLSKRILFESDCIVAIGASLNQWTTLFGELTEGKPVVQIDTDQEAIGVYTRVAVGVIGDARASAALLAERLRPMLHDGGDGSAWRRDVADAIELFEPPPTDYWDDPSGGTLDPRRVLEAVESALPKTRNLVIDAGHYAIFAAQILSAASDRDWCCAFDFGAIGQGLALAIGACFARPGERVTLIAGDGSFLMNLADLDTAVRYDLPLTILVCNDQGFGQERHDLERRGLPGSYADIRSPDIAAIARGFGASGLRVDSLPSLAQMTRALAKPAGVMVFDARINGDVESPVSQEIAKKLR